MNEALAQPVDAGEVLWREVRQCRGVLSGIEAVSARTRVGVHDRDEPVGSSAESLVPVLPVAGDVRDVEEGEVFGVQRILEAVGDVLVVGAVSELEVQQYQDEHCARIDVGLTARSRFA